MFVALVRVVRLLILLLLMQPALAFDRGLVGDEYQQWFRTFLQDSKSLRAALIKNPELTAAEADQLCAASIVPHSRMSVKLLEMLRESATKGDARARGEIVFFGTYAIFGRMLEHSIPAGDGGVWQEPKPEMFAMPNVRVMYMHIHGDESLERYFADAEQFPSYFLPKEGVLERNAYPFLLFQRYEGRLRLAGIGQEYWGAVVSRIQRQYH